MLLTRDKVIMCAFILCFICLNWNPHSGKKKVLISGLYIVADNEKIIIQFYIYYFKQ